MSRFRASIALAGGLHLLLVLGMGWDTPQGDTPAAPGSLIWVQANLGQNGSTSETAAVDAPEPAPRRADRKDARSPHGTSRHAPRNLPETAFPTARSSSAAADPSGSSPDVALRPADSEPPASDAPGAPPSQHAGPPDVLEREAGGTELVGSRLPSRTVHGTRGSGRAPGLRAAAVGAGKTARALARRSRAHGPRLQAAADPCHGMFPREAEHDHGSVVLAFEVTPSGELVRSRVLDESPRGEGFARAARACLPRLRFEPAANDAGEPVASESIVRLHFDRG